MLSPYTRRVSVCVYVWGEGGGGGIKCKGFDDAEIIIIRRFPPIPTSLFPLCLAYIRLTNRHPPPLRAIPGAGKVGHALKERL